MFEEFADAEDFCGCVRFVTVALVLVIQGIDVLVTVDRYSDHLLIQCAGIVPDLRAHISGGRSPIAGAVFDIANLSILPDWL